MKIRVSEKFLKSIPRESQENLYKKLHELQLEILQPNMGIFGSRRGKESKKFKGKSIPIFKFRVNESDRVIYTYFNESLEGNQKDGIFLLKYVSDHDEQDRDAKTLANNRFTNLASSLNFMPEDIQEIGELEKAEQHYFEGSFDLERIISYTYNESMKNEVFFEPYLNQLQKELIGTHSPMLIVGGAGSGKTLVCIYKADSYKDIADDVERNVAYFTYSARLKKSAEEYYDNINSDKKQVEFYDMTNFLENVLGEDHTNFVGYHRFANWLNEINPIMLSSITPYEIWTEIRGTIKGGMDEQWNRNHFIPFNKYQGCSFEYLKNKCILVQHRNEKRQLVCTVQSDDDLDKVIDMIQTDENNMEKTNCIGLIRDIYMETQRFKYSTKQEILIPEHQYLDYGKSEGRYNIELLKSVYSLASSYQDWIIEKKLFDDNDLAGKILSTPQRIRQFHYLVVDEVQDLTDLQIYLLFQMAKNKYNVTFAGDIHQMIKPTRFSNKHLSQLFYKKAGVKLDIRTLNRNYRNPDDIVQLAFWLIHMRQRYIAKEDSKTESNESLDFLHNSGNPPIHIFRNEELLMELVHILDNNGDAAIIIPDNSCRERFGSSANVFTVEEAKGKEFEHVLLYNLSSRYQEQWDEILNSRTRKKYKYRYYFNVLYVGITRARRNLYLYEDSNVLNSAPEFSDYVMSVNKFDIEIFGLSQYPSTSEEWNIRALKFEKDEDYQFAIRYYEKAGNSDATKRCFAKKAYQEGKHENSVHLFMELCQFKEAFEFYKDQRNKELGIMFQILTGESTMDEIHEIHSEEKVVMAVQAFISQFGMSEPVYASYVKPKLENLNQVLRKSKKLINEGVHHFGK